VSGEGRRLMPRPGVLVVDDHPMWRAGVRADLEADGRYRVVGEAADAEEAVAQARASRPDIVLLDLNLPGASGVAAIGPILAELPRARVLVLSASAEEGDVLAAVKAGASGYLLKSASGPELLDAVDRVGSGDAVFSPQLAALVLGEFRRVATTGGDDRQALTPREQEVLRLVAKGYSYKEIAERLVLSIRTVQNHVQHILDKLQMHGRYELMRYAIRRGMDQEP
jgi:DNA-binding NarL/FixJ family response regulator